MRRSLLHACGVAILSASLFACASAPEATKPAVSEESSDARPTVSQESSDTKPPAPEPTAAPTAAPPEEQIDSVTITKRYPAVGDKSTSVKAQSIELRGVVKGAKGEERVESRDTEAETKVEECLAVTSKSCTKLRVTYSKHVERKTVNGEDKGPKVDALDGKTFIVEVKGEDISVSLENGHRVDGAAVTALKKEYKSLPLRSKVIDSLPTAPVKVGDSLDGLANALLEVVKSAEQKADKATAKASVKAIKNDGGKKIVTIEITMSLEGHEDKMKLRLDVNGTIDLRADVGLPVGSELGGPVSVDFGDTGKLSGKMKETVKTTLSF